MTISEGDTAPDFELPDETGTPRKLSELLQSGPVVLFFYPAAMTSGCTKESCHFRDLAAEFDGGGRAAGGHQRRRGRQAAAVLREARVRLPVARRRRPNVAETFGVKRGGISTPRSSARRS